MRTPYAAIVAMHLVGGCGASLRGTSAASGASDAAVRAVAAVEADAMSTLLGASMSDAIEPADLPVGLGARADHEIETIWCGTWRWMDHR